MFVLVDLFVCAALIGGMFSLSTIGCFYNSFLLHTKYIKHHDNPLPPSPRLPISFRWG
jgi:hypothetical protein